MTGLLSAFRPGGAFRARLGRACPGRARLGRGTVRALGLAAALVVASASPPGDARAGEGDLVFEASLDTASVKLGDDVTILLSVTNRTAQFVQVPTMRLARDAVSVPVSWGGVVRTTVTRIYGAWTEEDGGLRLRPEATPRRRIAPGGTYRGSVTFAAVAAGDLILSPVLGAEGPERLAAKPLALEVTPKSGTPRRLVAQVETSAGAFSLEFDGAGAFNAVSHVWRLAREGFYDGLPVHRVLPRLLAQSGCPRGTGSGDPGWTLPAEGDGRPLARGAFGLARAAHPDTAGSQWFVIADADGAAAGSLRAEWTPLGRVLDGQSVVDALAAVESDPRTGRPATPPRVLSVRTTVQ